MSVFVAVLVLVAVFAVVFDGVRGYGHDQTPVLHTLEADEAVGELGHLGRFSVNDQHFKTGVVVKMRMAGGDDEFVTGVLHFSQLFRDAAGVMVVDEGDGAHHGRVRRGGLLTDQAVADEVAKGLGAVGIAAMADGTIEPLEKVGIEGNADSA